MIKYIKSDKGYFYKVFNDGSKKRVAEKEYKVKMYGGKNTSKNVEFINLLNKIMEYFEVFGKTYHSIVRGTKEEIIDEYIKYLVSLINLPKKNGIEGEIQEGLRQFTDEELKQLLPYVIKLLTKAQQQKRIESTNPNGNGNGNDNGNYYNPIKNYIKLGNKNPGNGNGYKLPYNLHINPINYIKSNKNKPENNKNKPENNKNNNNNNNNNKRQK